MPYEIWQSLQAKQKLEILEQNNQEIVEQIWEQLNQLSITCENWITGMPERPELFTINNCIIIYHVWHKLKIIEVVDIREML